MVGDELRLGGGSVWEGVAHWLPTPAIVPVPLTGKPCSIFFLPPSKETKPHRNNSHALYHA